MRNNSLKMLVISGFLVCGVVFSTALPASEGGGLAHRATVSEHNDDIVSGTCRAGYMYACNDYGQCDCVSAAGHSTSGTSGQTCPAGYTYFCDDYGQCGCITSPGHVKPVSAGPKQTCKTEKYCDRWDNASLSCMAAGTVVSNCSPVCLEYKTREVCTVVDAGIIDVGVCGTGM